MPALQRAPILFHRSGRWFEDLLCVNLLAALEQGGSIHRSKQMNESGNQPCPSGLVARSQSGSVVAMEVFVEQQIIAPIRIGLEFFRAPIHRQAPVLIAEENTGQAITDFMAHLKQIHQSA